jgi:hypothetical protein
VTGTRPSRPTELVLRPAAAGVAAVAYLAIAPSLPGSATAPGAAATAASATLALALLAALVLALAPIAEPGVQGVWLAAGALPAAALAQLWGPQAVATPLKAVAAAGIGYALARLLSTPGQLLAIAAIAMVVDTVSVAVGPTRTALEEAPDAAEAVALHLPAWGGGAELLVGAVDMLFLATFVSAARRVGLRRRATALAVTGGLVASAILAVAVDRPLPAIPLMALGLWAANADLLGRRAA